MVSCFSASFMTKTFIHNEMTYKLNIWDTAGQEMYRALAPMYYRQASVCVVVYDVTQMDTFVSVRAWIKELRGHITADNKTLIAIAGNKCDLNDKRVVPTEEAKAFADKMGAEFVETSAKSAQNVNQLFCMIAQRLPRNETNVGNIRLVERTANERTSKCC